MSKKKSVAAIKIGKRIRAVRTQLGISLEDLGHLSEISWTNIGKIERGDSSPTAESLVRLATALEVDPGRFLSGVSADDYGKRSHRFTVRDLIKGRDDQLAAHLAASESDEVEPEIKANAQAEAQPSTSGENDPGDNTDSGDDADSPERPTAN